MAQRLRARRADSPQTCRGWEQFAGVGATLLGNQMPAHPLQVARSSAAEHPVEIKQPVGGRPRAHPVMSCPPGNFNAQTQKCRAPQFLDGAFQHRGLLGVVEASGGEDCQSPAWKTVRHRQFSRRALRASNRPPHGPVGPLARNHPILNVKLAWGLIPAPAAKARLATFQSRPDPLRCGSRRIERAPARRQSGRFVCSAARSLPRCGHRAQSASTSGRISRGISSWGRRGRRTAIDGEVIHDLHPSGKHAARRDTAHRLTGGPIALEIGKQHFKNGCGFGASSRQG